MDSYERELVEFAVRWCPYGGGDEHILPEFGISPGEFYRRVLTTLDTQPTPESATALGQWVRLRKLCRNRIHHYSSGNCQLPPGHTPYRPAPNLDTRRLRS
jgi:hypothetical protein